MHAPPPPRIFFLHGDRERHRDLRGVASPEMREKERKGEGAERERFGEIPGAQDGRTLTSPLSYYQKKKNHHSLVL